MNTLINEVDRNAAETVKVYIGREPVPEDSLPLNREDYEAMQFLPLGTQVGFEPSKLGKLWNALAKLALHIGIPTSKDVTVNQYGDVEKIACKVREALAEIREVSEGTLAFVGIGGQEVSFECSCGAKNKRRLELLNDGQTVNCIRPNCNESYKYEQADMSFVRRVFEVVCSCCNYSNSIPQNIIDKLPTNRAYLLICSGCGENNYLSWELNVVQRTMPLTTD
ncbi:hypothetical protein [Pseudovibrio exalbescens]|nr:hypothetical protein [Pseudovibrio exalbescens]